jgi:trehalose-phosphatase
VGVPRLIYAGSHGFDVEGPGGLSEQRGDAYLPALDEAFTRLESAAESMEGVSLERKRYAVAVHFRRAGQETEGALREQVEEVARGIPELRITGGKMIFELRPNLDWDKGKALLHLLEVMGFGKDRERAVPLYLGDDLTDEDAFGVIREEGIGIVVRGENDDRETKAKYALADPAEVRAFLEHLVTMMKRRAV